jgi:hypothetical protein
MGIFALAAAVLGTALSALISRSITSRLKQLVERGCRISPQAMVI